LVGYLIANNSYLVGVMIVSDEPDLTNFLTVTYYAYMISH